MSGMTKTCAGCAYLRDRMGYSGYFDGFFCTPITAHREFKCVRFPNEAATAPSRFCGEFLETPDPLGDDTDATRAIAAWEVEHGTSKEVWASWNEKLLVQSERRRVEDEARWAQLAAKPKAEVAPPSSLFDWLFGS